MQQNVTKSDMLNPAQLNIIFFSVTLNLAVIVPFKHTTSNIYLTRKSPGYLQKAKFLCIMQQFKKVIRCIQHFMQDKNVIVFLFDFITNIEESKCGGLAT